MDINQKFCQSCGMPLTTEEAFGTNADGSKNEDYCNYCYQSGKFTSEMSMDEMIEFCVPYVLQDSPGMTADAARSMLRETYPQLKRWKQ